MTTIRREREKVVDLVRDAGGEVVGRTKLQKIAYLLELTGQGEGFEFEYRHYGPYSESLSEAVKVANLFGILHEEERTAKWGGHYSIYRVQVASEAEESPRAKFAKIAAGISSVELELAATAAYLSAVEHVAHPWEETQHRKPEKAADGRLEKAKEAYQRLCSIESPRRLPSIV